MVEAAPAEEPHMAVVPGRICIRVMTQPQNVLMAMTERTISRNSGQRERKVLTRLGETMPAIIIASTT